MELDGKVAIVTGASRGIGKGIAISLAKAGAKVVVCARSESQGKIPGTIHETVDAITKAGGEAVAVRCDVSSEDDIKAMVRETLDRFGRIDVMVNNAGGSFRYEAIETYPLHRFDRLMSVNVRSVFLSCQAILPTMIQQRSGSIINITSGAGQTFRYPGDTIYGLSKAAVDRFTMGLGHETRKHNISVVALNPGPVKTEGAELVYPKDHDWSGWQDPLDMGPPVVWLAQQSAQTMPMRVLNALDFGAVWP